METLPGVRKALTPAERKRFEQCKKVIKEKLPLFFEVGMLFAEIRDSELYAEDYDSFEDFCLETYGVGKSYAYRLIEAAEVKNSISQSPMGDWISTERQARELAKVEKRNRIRVLKIAAAAGPVTAEAIKEAAKTLSPEEQAKKDLEESEDAKGNGKVEIVYDETGLPVPRKILELWNRGPEVQKLMSAISTVKGALERAQTENDPLFRPCTSQNTGGQAQSWATLIISLKNAYLALKQAKPYAVCPTCQGKMADTCTQCQNRGIVSEFFWKTCTAKETREMREKIVANLKK